MATSKSAAKLIPTDPAAVMVIRDITPNLTTLSVPFLRFGLMKVGGRGTIVKLKSSALAVFSPVALTPAVKAKVNDLGTVKYLIAPDIEHHIFLSAWANEYPNCTVIGMEGLPEKREHDTATRGTPFAHVFTKSNKLDMRIDPEFDAEFEYEFFDSHANKELVFLHKPTRTLIEADLFFNLPATEQYSKMSGQNATSGLFTRFFGSIMNTKGKAIWHQRFLWYAAGSKDRKGFTESAKRVVAWDFDRIVPCHGDVIETGGKATAQKLLKWFTEGKH